MGSIKELVDRVIEDGILSPAEHEELISVISADGEVDREESEQIKRVFDLISAGKLKVSGTKRNG